MLWLDLKNRCRRLLQDTSDDKTNTTYADDDMLDYVNSALVDISSHTAKKVEWITTLEQPASQLEMPADFMKFGPIAVQVQGLYWQFMEPYTWQPSDTLPTPYAFSLSQNGYFEWPKGTINFTWLVPANMKLRFDYFGYWSPVIDDNSILNMRQMWMADALQWNILFRAMLKIATQAANLRQYNIKVDSGTPEDNPMLKMAREFRKFYWDILGEHPSNLTEVWGPQGD